jgi:hypothetical protein
MVGFSDMVSGLFGGGSTDPNAIDPATGLSEAQKYQTYSGGLAQLGGLLMAAGQKQMPADRAKYLAQLGSIPGAMNQQTTQMMQQKLLMENTKGMQQRNVNQQQLSEYFKSPEVQKMIEGLPDYSRPAAAAAARANDIGTFASMTKPSDKQREIGELVAAGHDKEIATKIAYGVLKLVPDGFGGQTLIDTTKMLPGQNTKMMTMPSTGQGAALNPQQNVLTGGLPTAAPVPAQPMIRPDVAYNSPLGISGAIQNIGSGFKNAFAGTSLGSGQPSETTTAADRLAHLQQQTSALLTSEIPGRPTDKMRAIVGNLTVDPSIMSNLTTTEVAQKSKLEQTRNVIDEEINRINNDVLGQPQIHHPADLKKASDNLSQLYKLKRSYDTVLGSFNAPAQSSAPQAPAAQSGGPASGVTANGIKWRMSQ